MSQTRPALWQGLRPWLLPLTVTAACLFLAGWHMRVDWTWDETYRYGWVVPFLAGWLAWQRWADRPVPHPPAPGSPERRRTTAAWSTLAASLYPIWILREANPDWRLVGIFLGLIAVAAVLLLLTEAGGRPWRRHFFAAVLFLLIAVPWPSNLERLVSGLLMPANATIALEAIHWLGVPAIRSGNLITMAQGTLGVEEACSGIRSLQSTLMMALFLGELNRLSLRRRALLVAAAVGIALLTNAIRTTALSVLAARSGMPAAEDWHDRAGLFALIANSLVLILLARRPAGAWPAPTVPAPLRPPATLTGPAVCAAALTFLLPATWLWYRRSETRVLNPPWHVDPPVSAPGFAEVPMNARTTFMLRQDEGWSARWTGPDGHRVQAMYYRWKPGSTPSGHMNVHRPDGCLANMGIHLDEELAPMDYTRDGVHFPVRMMRFTDRSDILHVAYLVLPDRVPETGPDATVFDFDYANRLRAVLQGHRNPGQRMIEIGWWGSLPAEEARRRTTEFLDAQLKIGS